jgi:hypothetical protein
MFETNDSPPQMVHEAFKEGYMFHEQLLRPAMVVVTKTPAAAPAPVAQEAASDEDVSEEAAPQESDSEATS